MITTLLFILFAGTAIGCAVTMVAQRNPLYSAISLVGVLLSLACLYVMLAAPFIAAVQVIVYAGAIMVLVVFVIMLLNVEDEEPHRNRLAFLAPTAIGLAAVLIAETAFILYSVQASPYTPRDNVSNVGLTASVGTGLFTEYLLPFEITSVLLLMAIVGAMSLARRSNIISATSRVVPGSQVLARNVLDSLATDEAVVETDSTVEARFLMGVDRRSDPDKRG